MKQSTGSEGERWPGWIGSVARSVMLCAGRLAPARLRRPIPARPGTEVGLEHEAPRHEKIRFRRDEIADLGTLPSAAMPGSGPAKFRRRRRGRAVALGLVAVAAIPLIAMSAAFAVGALGIGSERLRREAERAIEALAGPGFDAEAGPVQLTFDPSRLLSLEVRDIALQRARGEKLLEARSVRFGIRLLPLFSGEVRLSSAELSNARIVAAAGGGSGWTAVRNAQGLIDPDLITDAVFGAVHSAFHVMGHGSTEDVRLENVEMVLPPGGAFETLRLVEATLSASGPGEIILEARAEVDGRIVGVAARAMREPATGRITGLEFSASADPPSGTRVNPEPVHFHRLGAFRFDVNGAEGDGERASRLVASLQLQDSGLHLGRHGVLAGDVEFRGTLVEGSNKVAVDRLEIAVGRSRLAFYGAIGPRPPTGGEADAAAYRFDLISSGSTIAPEASTEPALNAYLRLTGHYVAAEQRLDAEEIVVNSGRGEALGSLSARFVGDQAPGITTAFSVTGMPVAEVKQLWPWFSASGARGWVMDNVFGGRVAEGRVQFHVEPGRMGNGVPMNADEVSGFFALEGTRFDTAGLIPPVRDAVGSVDFRGNDVEIALSSGTVFLPSGRTVAASNGTMRIESANVRPVIGALDIDVAGEAPAVAELASYDPINAMRLVGLSAGDFSGNVSGHVTADIPLQKGIDASGLGWLVALDYENLSIARPIDGQLVTEAAGSIRVEPRRAVITAKAKLNGVDAEIEAVEPLGRNAAADRQRLVRLVLDDEARETIAPGISDLVKGKVSVALDVAGSSRRVEADLTAAELWVPWTGWTKGAGVPAEVSFQLDTSEGATTLSEFRLSGGSFDVQGSLTLSEAASRRRGSRASSSTAGMTWPFPWTGRARDFRSTSGARLSMCDRSSSSSSRNPAPGSSAAREAASQSSPR